MKNVKKIAGRLLMLLVLLALPTGEVRAENEEYLHEENFLTDSNLTGLFGSCEEYFQTGNWNIKEAKLTLYYTATNLVREEVSDFTVSLNGEPIYSQNIPLTAGETQKITISLPQRLIKQGSNSIRVESYIRTNEDDPCVDDVSGASWMVIRKESGVAVSYRSNVTCQNIADVYQQITSIEALENKSSAVILPANPTENELSAMANLLGGIAQNAVLHYDNLALVNADGAGRLPDYRYSVYLCEYNRLPAGIRNLLSEEQKKSAEEEAVIVFTKTEEGNDLLIVTGGNAAAFQNACRLFGNPLSMEQTQGSARQVSETENVNVVIDKEEKQLITQTGSYLSGLFEQTASFTIDMSANRKIAAGSQVEIRFRYAQNLDFDRSLITVAIGDTPIGSKKLEKSNANADSFTINIPDNLEITGSFSLNVIFNLEIKDLYCDMRKQDMPWAYITNESTISLRTEEVSWLLFDYYPGPFLYEGRFNQVMIVLPTEESEEDMEAMRSILLTMGRYLIDNAGTMKVVRADHAENLSDYNIISIGCLSQNPIVQQINEQLYFRFSDKGTTILSNEKMRIEANYGARLGTAQLLHSPYGSKDKALLIVSGVNKAGMLQAAEYLGDIQKRWYVYGDGFVTDGEQINCYRFGEDNEKQGTLLTELNGRESAVVLVAIGGGVIILMIISLILIWNKHRRRR